MARYGEDEDGGLRMVRIEDGGLRMVRIEDGEN